MKSLINSHNSKLILLIFIILIGVFLRFYNFNFQDFWWDELMEFSTSDPTINLKETFLRAHNLTVDTTFSFDYATNANFYFYIYKFFLEISYSAETARIITASFGVLVFLISSIIYKKFIGEKFISLSLLIAFNYYLIIQSQEFKYNIFFCFMCLISIYFFFLWVKKINSENNEIIKFVNFIVLLLTMWTHIFGFLIFLSQIIVLFFKKKDILFKNFFYYLSLPIIYVFINFRQLKNFLNISEFPVPQISSQFFFDYDFKYFFGSIISGKVFLIFFLILFIYFFKKINKTKFEIIFLFILLFLSYFLPLFYSLISKPIFQTRYVIYLIPVILFLMVFMIEEIKTNIIKVSILSFLIFISSSNTLYSLYFLEKNDKPHITKILYKIKEQGKDENIVVATSSEYLLNFLKRKNKFNNLNIRFINCEQTDNLILKSYWEISIFPEYRFEDCYKKLKKKGYSSRERKFTDSLQERYAYAKLITFVN